MDRVCLPAATVALVCALAVVVASDIESTELRMPGVKPDKADTYLCYSIRLNLQHDNYLVGFTPHGSMETAHHMLLFGCAEPGSPDEEPWNCGEMNSGRGSAPPCAEGSQIIYAWAKDAPKLELPDGVGFKVGGDSGVAYLVLQVHYMHPMDHRDYSGLTLKSTEERMPKRAQTLLLATGGGMAAKTKENFEAACVIDEDVEMHPFAFRTHAHKHGKFISGWKVTTDAKNEDHWELIGGKSPQVAQMFYPVANPKMVLHAGDVVAARCSMQNDDEHDVMIGATGADEMCNFYMMYWVLGDHVLSDNTCYSPGPPSYHWADAAGLNHIPKDA